MASMQLSFDTPQVKRCSRCSQVKPVGDFARRKGAPDGLHGWCRPCFRAYYNDRNQQWRSENRERHNGNQRRQYAANVEARRARKRAYDAANRAEVNARARERHHSAYAVPEKRARMLERAHKRRLKTQNDASLAEFIAKLYVQPCSYCGATSEIEIDHVIPLSRGGTHTIDNLAPACGFCNRSKKDRLLSEWASPKAVAV